MQHRLRRAAQARALFPAFLLALLALAACGRLTEPAQDPWTVAALDDLAAETGALFDAIEADPSAAGHAARSAAYASIALRSQAVSARAAARRRRVEDAADAVATTGFLADFRAHLDRLAEHDAARAALGLGLAPHEVALRRTALADALNDAIFYERHVLARTR